MTNSITTEVPPRPPAAGRPLRSRRAFVVVAAAVVAVIVLVWLVAFSPVLGVKSVSVRGVRLLTADQVRTAAAIKHGTPLLRLDTTAALRRVEQLPEVKSATVSKGYPNTVTITVVERAPVGFLAGGDGRFVLVDASGVRFRSVSTRPARLPLFVVATGAQSGPAAAAVATVAGDLPGSLLARIQSIQALDPAAITLLLTDSRVVRWGSVARSADKAQILPALLSQPGTQFDVSNPDQVTAR